MNKELKKWLDANTTVETDAGSAYWYYNASGTKTIDARDINTPAYISLMLHGDPIYTDCLSYCNHGLGDGVGGNDEDDILALMPPALADALRGEYAVDGSLEDDLAEYLHDKTEWTPDYDYYDQPADDDDADDEAIAALGIPHDEEEDKCKPGEYTYSVLIDDGEYAEESDWDLTLEQAEANAADARKDGKTAKINRWIVRSAGDADFDCTFDD